jgi:hypothetical protein
MNVFLAVQFAAFCKQETRIKFIESSWRKIEYAELKLVMEDARIEFIEFIESSWQKIEYRRIKTGDGRCDDQVY